MVLLVACWENFLIQRRVCHCDFFSEPLIQFQSLLLRTFQYSTPPQSSVKSFSEPITLVICCRISEPLDILPFGGCGNKVKYMMFSGENALFPDVANIALAKRPQQALTVENLSLLIFLWKLSGLTHRNISQRHKRYIGAKAQRVDVIHKSILRNPKIHSTNHFIQIFNPMIHQRK